MGSSTDHPLSLVPALDECGLAMEVIARAIDLDLDAMEVDVDTDAEHSSKDFAEGATCQQTSQLTGAVAWLAGARIAQWWNCGLMRERSQVEVPAGRRENFLLQGQLSVLTLFEYPFHPCFTAGGRMQLNTHAPYGCGLNEVPV